MHQLLSSQSIQSASERECSDFMGAISQVEIVPLSYWPKNTERPPENVPCVPKTTVKMTNIDI